MGQRKGRSLKGRTASVGVADAEITVGVSVGIEDAEATVDVVVEMLDELEGIGTTRGSRKRAADRGTMGACDCAVGDAVMCPGGVPRSREEVP